MSLDAVRSERLVEIRGGTFLRDGEGIIASHGELKGIIVRPIESIIPSAVKKIGEVFLTSLKAFKGVLGDMNATADLLKLIVNAAKLTENKFPSHTLLILSRAFKTITEFNSARSWLSRSYSILSWEAATEEKIGKHYDYLRVANKAVSLISDGCSTIKWLNSIGLISSWLVTAKVSRVVFGSTFVMSLDSISSVATVVATVPNLIDNIRLAVKYGLTRTDVLNEARKIKLVTYSFDSVSDICRIASVVLFPWMPVLGLALNTAGTAISLCRFYYVARTLEAKEKEKSEYAAKREVVLRLAERCAQLAAKDLNIGFVSRSISECIQRKLDLQSPVYIQRTSMDTLVVDVLDADGLITEDSDLRLLAKAKELSNLDVPPVISARGMKIPAYVPCNV